MNMVVDAATLDARSVGDIAASLPGATAVFRRFKLDFCCGGELPLAQAAAARGADLPAIKAALAALVPDPGAPENAETSTLIAYIVERFHQTHRRELPELVRLSTRVEAVHRNHPSAPQGLADALERLSGELGSHMMKEEQVLFPLMLQGADPMIAYPIAQMRHEHDDHGAALERIEEIAGGFVLPADACRSWQALYAGTQKLVVDLTEHVHLENNVLFPRFAAPIDH